jgi:N-acetyl-anhydromuramyl-L-alanine amidase AmpD
MLVSVGAAAARRANLQGRAKDKSDRHIVRLGRVTDAADGLFATHQPATDPSAHFLVESNLRTQPRFQFATHSRRCFASIGDNAC